MAGHCGVKKTAARLKITFTWPGMSTDVKVVRASCPQCQKAERIDQGRAPLVLLPVITVPFARLAFDVVVPLPRSRSGFKYVLTCMCYASKYPDAVPMKRADAKDQVRVHVCVNLHVLCIKIPGCCPHEEGRCQSNY